MIDEAMLAHDNVLARLESLRRRCDELNRRDGLGTMSAEWRRAAGEAENAEVAAIPWLIAAAREREQLRKELADRESEDLAKCALITEQIEELATLRADRDRWQAECIENEGVFKLWRRRCEEAETALESQRQATEEAMRRAEAARRELAAAQITHAGCENREADLQHQLQEARRELAAEIVVRGDLMRELAEEQREHAAEIAIRAGLIDELALLHKQLEARKHLAQLQAEA